MRINPSLTPRFAHPYAAPGTNLERAGDHNQRVTLHAIRLHGPITRADLVGFTGLTAPAIANITKRLIQENLIKEAGRQRGARGTCLRPL